MNEEITIGNQVAQGARTIGNQNDFGSIAGKPITAHWEFDLPGEDGKPVHAILNFTGQVTQEALENLRTFVLMQLDIMNGQPAGTTLLKERKQRGRKKKPA